MHVKKTNTDVKKLNLLNCVKQEFQYSVKLRLFDILMN